LGVALLWLLPDRPATASWLTAEEKTAITQRLAAEPPGELHGFWQMLKDKRIWILIIPDFSIVIGLYGLGLWMPQIINGLGFSHLQTGFLVMVPYLTAMAVMLLVGASSDRSGERVFHVAGSALVAAAGLLGAAFLRQPVAVMLALCVASAGIYSALAVFWTLPTAILRGLAAAGGLALLNSFANLGGYFGPDLMGWAKQATGDFTLGLSLLAGMETLAAVTVILIGRVFFPRARGVAAAKAA
jgi:ACS family tartrate transporter-like MFS transporter